MIKKLNTLLFLSAIEHNLLTPIIRPTILPSIQTRTMSDYSTPVLVNDNDSTAINTKKPRAPRKKRTTEETENSGTVVAKKTQRKKRTPDEIEAENTKKEQIKQQKQLEAQRKADEKETKKQQRAIKKDEHSSKLVPGTNIYALSGIQVLKVLANSKSRTNLAFQHMFASRIIFPPRKNINKFATGGIAEESMSRLLCDVGFVCNNLSDEANVIDLAVQVPIHQGTPEQQIVSLNVSLKNSGKLASSPILENYRGQKRPEIRALPPTFIVETDIKEKRARIVYMDEEILRQGYPGLSDAEFRAKVYANNDSNLTFKSGFLTKFVPRLPDEYVLNAEFPEDLAGLSERSFAKLALAEVIRQLAK
jgi:hypothetical protein